MPLPAALLRAQRVSLFGYGYAAPGSDMHEFSNFQGEGFGAVLPAYDLNTPGAVAEIKGALRALAQKGSDAFVNPGPDAVVETTWKLLTNDDVWDAPTGQEFLLAMARYGAPTVQVEDTGPATAAIKNTFRVIGPFVQQGQPGGSPQPTVSGLETLAGAARNSAGVGPSMPLYEAWRAKGCTVCFAPPSSVSMPPASTPVTPTFNTGPRLVAPPNADPAALQRLALYDAALQAQWQIALTAINETQAADYAAAMDFAQKNRNAAAQLAIDSAPERQGVTVLDTAMTNCLNQNGNWDPSTQTCSPGAGSLAPSGAAKASMTGPIVIVSVLALGAYWLFAGKKASR